jgi:hypothetical protein
MDIKNASWYLAFFLICLIAAYDFIDAFHESWFMYLTFITMFLGLLVWEEQPGISMLLVILFLQSTKPILTKLHKDK